MRVRAEALARHGLAPEVVELVLGQAALEERPGVDPGCGVALVEDLVARALAVLAAEEVVEPDFVERGRGGVRRQVPTDAGEPVVGAQDHRDGVPADDPADALLERLVTREVRFLLRADRVDVPGLGQRREPDLQLSGALEQLVDEEASARLAFLLHHLVQRRHPVVGLGRVDIGELVLELVEIHHGEGSPSSPDLKVAVGERRDAVRCYSRTDLAARVGLPAVRPVHHMTIWIKHSALGGFSGHVTHQMDTERPVDRRVVHPMHRRAIDPAPVGVHGHQVHIGTAPWATLA